MVYRQYLLCACLQQVLRIFEGGVLVLGKLEEIALYFSQVSFLVF